MRKRKVKVSLPVPKILKAKPQPKPQPEPKAPLDPEFTKIADFLCCAVCGDSCRKTRRFYSEGACYCEKHLKSKKKGRKDADPMQ